jgi:hypothetical protein
MMDIREQAKQHNMRFGKEPNKNSDGSLRRDDGGGASAASRGDIVEK